MALKILRVGNLQFRSYSDGFLKKKENGLKNMMEIAEVFSSVFPDDHNRVGNFLKEGGNIRETLETI